MASPNGTIVFIESNTSGTGQLFIALARREGYTPTMVCGDPSRYPFVTADRIRVITADVATGCGRAEALRQIEEIPDLAGLYSTSEYFIGVAAELARALRLPGPDPDAVRICRDKSTQRHRLAGVLRMPACLTITSVDQVASALQQLPPPAIVKPVAGTGSVGVRLCRDALETAVHVATLLRRTTNERGMPQRAAAMIEEYVDAPEFSVEVLNGCAVGVTRKHLSAEPYFLEMGHDYPADVDAATRDALADAAVHAVRALGLAWGPTHVELRLADDGPVLIEVNPRLAGGHIPELVRLASGVDLIDATLRLVTGRPARTAARTSGAAAIRFLVPQGEGRIAALPDAASVGRDTGARLTWYRAVGDLVHTTHDFRDRVGHVIASAPDLGRARAAADAAQRSIAIPLQLC